MQQTNVSIHNTVCMSSLFVGERKRNKVRLTKFAICSTCSSTAVKWQYLIKSQKLIKPYYTKYHTNYASTTRVLCVWY